MSNNTEKLLRAFIEASGYEVEETGMETRINKEDLANMANPERPMSMIRIEDGTTDYKVTKKVDHLHEWYDDVPLNQLVRNVIVLSTVDAELRWIKYPKSSFYAVIKWFGDDAKRVNEHRYEILGVEVSLDEE